jgi:hypothetical protein
VQSMFEVYERYHVQMEKKGIGSEQGRWNERDIWVEIELNVQDHCPREAVPCQKCELNH